MSYTLRLTVLEIDDDTRETTREIMEFELATISVLDVATYMAGKIAPGCRELIGKQFKQDIDEIRKQMRENEK